MKSAYQLAMERLQKEHGEPQSLSDDQKQRLAEVSRETKARIAEQELALGPQIEAALAQGDVPASEQLREQLAVEIRKLREREETRKEAIRNEDASGGGGPPQAG